MKIYLLTLISCLILSCGNTQQQEPKDTTAVESTKSVSPSQTPAKQAPKTKAYKPPQPSKEPAAPVVYEEGAERPRIISDPARPKDYMKLDYPYDIHLQTPEDKIVNSEEMLTASEGKPTILLFWLTTCFPCKMEMAAIEKVYKQWEEETGVRLVALSVDFQHNHEKFKKMVADKNWPWEVYHDYNREFRRVMPGGLNGMPQTFLLDKNGEVIYHKRKYRPGDEKILYQKVLEVTKA